MADSTGKSRTDQGSNNHIIASKADNPVDAVLNNIRMSYNVTASEFNENKHLKVFASKYCKDVRFLLDVIVALAKKLEVDKDGYK